MGVPPPPLWRMPAGYPAGKWPFSTSPMLAVFSALRPPPRRQFSERHPCGCPRSLPAEQLLPCFALNGTPHASSSHLAPTLPHHPPPPSTHPFCAACCSALSCARSIATLSQHCSPAPGSHCRVHPALQPCRRRAMQRCGPHGSTVAWRATPPGPPAAVSSSSFPPPLFFLPSLVEIDGLLPPARWRPPRHRHLLCPFVAPSNDDTPLFYPPLLASCARRAPRALFPKAIPPKALVSAFFFCVSLLQATPHPPHPPHPPPACTTTSD